MRRGPAGVLILVALLLLSVTQVWANSAPPRWAGDKPGAVLPGASGQVHVAGEQLRFDVADDLASARVTARYDMENRGAALDRFPIVFVMQNGRDGGEPGVAVTWNGTAVPVERISQEGLGADRIREMNQAWTAMKTVVDPVDGARYESDFFGQTAMLYSLFYLDLGAGAKGTLSVTFRQDAAEDRTRHANRIYHYQYLLLPARGWASFGPLEIAIKAPPAFFAGNLPLVEAGDEYRASLPGLPEENLAFALMSRKGLIGNLVDPGPYYWMAFVLTILGAALVGLGLGRLAGLIRHAGWAVTAGVASGLVVGGVADVLLSFGSMSLFPALSGQSYGAAFVGIGQLLLAVPLTTVLAAVVARRRSAA